MGAEPATVAGYPPYRPESIWPESRPPPQHPIPPQALPYRSHGFELPSILGLPAFLVCLWGQTPIAVHTHSFSFPFQLDPPAVAHRTLVRKKTCGSTSLPARGWLPWVLPVVMYPGHHSLPLPHARTFCTDGSLPFHSRVGTHRNLGTISLGLVQPESSPGKPTDTRKERLRTLPLLASAI